jgi:outer membrane protein TolC
MQALLRRPEVHVIDAERDAASVEVQLAKNRRAPTASVRSYVAKDLGVGPVELAPVEWGVSLAISMPLPLRKARGEYQEARAEQAAIEARARGLADKIAAEVRLAMVSLEAAYRRWALAKEQVNLALILANAERVRFSEGASDLIVVNLRELAEADAESAVISAAAEYHVALAVFMTATGRSPL